MAAISNPSESEYVRKVDETSYQLAQSFDESTLPEHVQNQLLLLENQLIEGDITQKGYNKHRLNIWEKYVKKDYEDDGLSSNNNVSSTVLIEPDLNDISAHAVLQLENLKREYDNDELTLKGYNKRRFKVLEPYMLTEPPIDSLPSSVQTQYRLLEKELDEDDITEKGFKKKRTILLKPYLIPVDPSSYPSKRKKTRNGGQKSTSSSERKQTRYSKVFFDDGSKLFKCDVCGEMFKQPQSFSGHYRSHRADLVKHFVCTMCDAAFTTKSHLKIHMYKHTGDYPFSCEICGKGFGAKSSAKAHEERHTKKESLQCGTCGGLFLLKKQLLDHESTCQKEEYQELDVNRNVLTENIILTNERLEIHLSTDDDPLQQQHSTESTNIETDVIEGSNASSDSEENTIIFPINETN